jgi:hypothetical protein
MRARVARVLRRMATRLDGPLIVTLPARTYDPEALLRAMAEVKNHMGRY